VQHLPGVISLFFGNDYYASHEEYVFAIAEAMRHEYEATAKLASLAQGCEITAKRLFA
jgi:5-methyltetrahydropteroyltriglutamate--homocysteine methyltransferase